MNTRDQHLSVVRAKGIDLRPVGFLKPSTPKVQGGVLVKGAVSIAEIECAFQNADGVVVGFLAPAIAVCDADET
jgi:hypothetical protein